MRFPFIIIIKAIDFLYEPFHHVIDNYIKDTISEPAIGSIVYCDLAYAFEHSGIYVGDGKIVHLDGDGVIRIDSRDNFIKRLYGLNPALSVYNSCINDKSFGNLEIAEYARSKIGEHIEYNIIWNNCHMFTVRCIRRCSVGNDYARLSSIKNVMWSDYGVKHWRVWKTL